MTEHLTDVKEVRGCDACGDDATDACPHCQAATCGKCNVCEHCQTYEAPKEELPERLRDPLKVLDRGERMCALMDEINGDCGSIRVAGRYVDLQDEIQRLREDLQRSESARIAILAENEHYKREAAEANAMLNSEWFARVTYKQQLREALDKLAKPAHEREPPHCSTCECWHADRRTPETTGDGAK